MKQENYLKFNSSFFKIVIYTLLINTAFFTASVLADNDKSQIKFEKFEDIFYGNDTKFEDKDNHNSQFDSFFGINYSLENRNFKDLSIPFNSRDIKKLFNDKLIQMSVKETNKSKDDFFNNRL